MRRRVLRAGGQQRGDQNLERILGLGFRDLLHRRQLHAGDFGGDGAHDSIDRARAGSGFLTLCSCSNRVVSRIYSLAVGVLLLATPPTLTIAQTPPPTELDPRIQQLVVWRVGGTTQRARQQACRHSGRATRSRARRPPREASAPRGSGSSTSSVAPALGFRSRFDTYKVARDGRITRNVELRNVLAVLPGKSSRRIYLTAHYDTVNIGDAGQIGANTRTPGRQAA